MKYATLNVFKIFVLCILVLLPNGSNKDRYENEQNLIKVDKSPTKSLMGKFDGNRNLVVGVKNILEELLLDLDYDLSDQYLHK